MSTRAGTGQQRFTRDTSGPPGRQPRRIVASYETYAEAERAVDRLSDDGFPVERVAIVGRGLHLVEQVTGRVNWGRAALHGAMSGAITGVVVGWLFGLLDWSDPILASGWLALHGLWIGALIGALIGLLAHALTGGRRDFASIAGMQADRYELLVDEEVAERAAQILKDTPAHGTA